VLETDFSRQRGVSEKIGGKRGKTDGVLLRKGRTSCAQSEGAQKPKLEGRMKREGKRRGGARETIPAKPGFERERLGEGRAVRH